MAAGPAACFSTLSALGGTGSFCSEVAGGGIHAGCGIDGGSSAFAMLSGWGCGTLANDDVPNNALSAAEDAGPDMLGLQEL